MRRYFLTIIFILFISVSFAQTDSAEAMFAFRITDYMMKLNDSTTIVQVALPDASPVVIKKEQVAVLTHRFENATTYDTSLIGWGRCQLIKTNYYYFTIHKYHSDEPRQGDLLYTKCKVPVKYAGLLFNIGRHAISLTKVDQGQFYYAIDVFSMAKEKEDEILDSMVADIQFTGKAMLKQMPEQNRDIKGGIYDGKKLFAAMQEIKKNELEEFLKYIFARPNKYAGNVWKISEVFATWMINGTPKVKEE